MSSSRESRTGIQPELATLKQFPENTSQFLGIFYIPLGIGRASFFVFIWFLKRDLCKYTLYGKIQQLYM